MPRPKPAEPWITIPVRVTAAQRKALDTYRDKHKLSTLADALRHMIEQQSLFAFIDKAMPALAKAAKPMFARELAAPDSRAVAIAVRAVRAKTPAEKAAVVKDYQDFGGVDALSGEPVVRSRASPKGGKR